MKNNYLSFPADKLSNIMMTIFNESNLDVRKKLAGMEDVILDRGSLIGKDKAGSPVKLVKLTQEESGWLKSLYENII